jgi:hypothetical protein
MKIADLANLVTVRNHLVTVIADTSITPKTEVKALNDLRRNLDKKFVESIKQLDVEALFAEEDFEKVYLQSKEKVAASLAQACHKLGSDQPITLEQQYPVEWLKVDTTISKEDIEKFKEAWCLNKDKTVPAEKTQENPKQLSLPFDNPPKPKKTRKKTSK